MTDLMGEAPRGQQYGSRQRTEAALDAVPMAEPGGVPQGQPAAPPQRRDPMEVAQQTNLPNLAGMDDRQMRSALAGLPQAAPPSRGLPAANREALDLLPLAPLFESVAMTGRASAGYLRWYRNWKSQIPPEVGAADAVG